MQNLEWGKSYTTCWYKIIIVYINQKYSCKWNELVLPPTFYFPTIGLNLTPWLIISTARLVWVKCLLRLKIHELSWMNGNHPAFMKLLLHHVFLRTQNITGNNVERIMKKLIEIYIFPNLVLYMQIDQWNLNYFLYEMNSNIMVPRESRWIQCS